MREATAGGAQHVAVEKFRFSHFLKGGDRVISVTPSAVNIEFSTSETDWSFRIYRVAGGTPDLSFVSVESVRAREELIMFSGDEGQAIHTDTERRFRKLSERGRSVARDLFRLPLAEMFIAIDELQLRTLDWGNTWSEELHQGVVAALQQVLGADVPVVQVPWEAMKHPPVSPPVSRAGSVHGGSGYAKSTT